MPEREQMAVLSLVVHPRSHHEAVAFEGDILHIWVTAPPVEGAANSAIIALLAKRLRIPRSHIAISRGQHARHKQVTVAGLDHATITIRLG